MRRRPEPPPDSPLHPGHPHYDPNPHAHPGLHVIALIEAVKGVLAIIAGSGLVILGPAPLQRWIHVLIARFQLDPEHGALALFAAKISQGAVHLPMTELAARLDEVPDGDPVYVICRSGGRSARVTAYLNQQGWDTVNVQGGMGSWSAAGRPMVAAGDAAPQVI